MTSLFTAVVRFALSFELPHPLFRLMRLRRCFVV